MSDLAGTDFDDLSFLLESPIKNSSNNENNNNLQHMPKKRQSSRKHSDLAERIAITDELVRQVKQLQEIQQHQLEFQRTSQEVSSLYEKEKRKRIALETRLTESVDRCRDLENQLDVQRINCERLEDELQNKVLPVDSKDIITTFLHFAQRIVEDHSSSSLTRRELTLIHNLKVYCKSANISIPTTSPSSSYSRRKARTTAVSHVTQETQTNPLPEMPSKPATCSIGVQSENLVTKRDQATQHKYMTTTRGTTTSSFIKKHDVGTCFPEPKPAPSVQQILHKMQAWGSLVNSPVSPITDLQPVAEVTESKHMGVCTDLCNVQRLIDYLPELPTQLKRSNSRPPSRSGIKDELPARGTYGLNMAKQLLNILPHNQSILANLPADVFEEIWQTMGQMMLVVLQQRSVNPLSILTPTINQADYANWLAALYKDSVPDQQLGHNSESPVSAGFQKSEAPPLDKFLSTKSSVGVDTGSDPILTPPVEQHPTCEESFGSQFSDAFYNMPASPSKEPTNIPVENSSIASHPLPEISLELTPIRLPVKPKSRLIIKPKIKPKVKKRRIRLKLQPQHKRKESTETFTVDAKESAVDFISHLKNNINCDIEEDLLDAEERQLLQLIKTAEQKQQIPEIATSKNMDTQINISPIGPLIPKDQIEELSDVILKDNVATQTSVASSDLSATRSYQVLFGSDDDDSDCEQSSPDIGIGSTQATNVDNESKTYPGIAKNTVEDDKVLPLGKITPSSTDGTEVTSNTNSDHLNEEQPSPIKPTTSSHTERDLEEGILSPKRATSLSEKDNDSNDATHNKPASSSTADKNLKFFGSDEDDISSQISEISDTNRITNMSVSYSDDLAVQQIQNGINNTPPLEIDQLKDKQQFMSDDEHFSDSSELVIDLNEDHIMNNKQQDENDERDSMMQVTSLSPPKLPDNPNVNKRKRKISECQFQPMEKRMTRSLSKQLLMINESKPEVVQQDIPRQSTTTSIDSPMSPIPWAASEETKSEPIEIPVEHSESNQGECEPKSMLGHIIYNSKRRSHPKQDQQKFVPKQLREKIVDFLKKSIPMDLGMLATSIAVNRIGVINLMITVYDELGETVSDRLLAWLKQLECQFESFIELFMNCLERRLFNLKIRLNRDQAWKLLRLFLRLIDLQRSLVAPGQNYTNPTRLLLYQILYYYNNDMPLMVLEVLCHFPTALPHREERSYDQSDPLITVIKHLLMCNKYDVSDPKGPDRQLISKLRFEYHFQPFEPTMQQVTDNLVEKLKAGHLDQLCYAFVLHCRRTPPEIVTKSVLATYLLPLANHYCDQSLQTEAYDERVQCLLQTISMIVKQLPLNNSINICSYIALFKRFLVAVPRPGVQQAAVQAILRTQRYGFAFALDALQGYKPTYQLESLTRAMLCSFVERRRAYQLPVRLKRSTN